MSFQNAPPNATPNTAPPDAVLLRLDFVCTRDERAEAKSLLPKPPQTSKWPRRAGGLLVLALMGWLMWEDMLKNATPTERVVWVSVFATIWIITFVCLRLARRESPVRVQVEIAPYGLHVNGLPSWGFVPWAALPRRTESPSLLILQQPPPANVPLVIPKRVLPSDEWLAWILAATAHAAR